MTNASSATAVPRVEWELLPSLLGRLGRRGPAERPAWSDTLPSELDVAMPSTPFEEVLPGLSMREVREPDIFAIFFG